MGIEQFDNLVVVRGIDKSLGIEGVVHIGAQKLHPSFFNHLIGLAARTLAIEALQRENIDLEIDAHILEMLELGRGRAIVRVAFRVGKNDLVVFHLEFEKNLVQSHNLLVK